MEQLLAITPIDGRYSSSTTDLSKYVSEYALFRYRLVVEVEYFIALCKQPIKELKNVDSSAILKLREIVFNFTPEECLKIKQIENKIKHDVKAVEYYLQEKFRECGLGEYISFIHFGLTSQDINSSAVILSIKNTIENEIYPNLYNITNTLKNMYDEYKNITMLSRTHGQAASPTTIGKELFVFYYRLQVQIDSLSKVEYRTKFGGAVGNFNAHKVAYPDIDWIQFADEFIYKLNLIRNDYTTQISNYDEISTIFDNIKRINTILINMNNDIWTYISLGYFKQKVNTDEVGSSTMPHKVNPINFENSEGNLIISISLLECLSRKLPISRMQRDLTDSTILRNIGSIFGYTLIGYKSLITGLSKLVINKSVIDKDLEDNYIVISEGIQTILRREGITDAYEKLKDLTRGSENLKKEDFERYINSLDISCKLKDELNSITVYNYIGYSDK